MAAISYNVNGKIESEGLTYKPSNPVGFMGSFVQYISGTDFFKTIGLFADFSGNKSLKDHCGIAGGSTSLAKSVKGWNDLNGNMDAKSHGVRFKFASDVAATLVWFSNACGKVPHVAFKIIKELGATLDDVCTLRHQYTTVAADVDKVGKLTGDNESLVKVEPYLGALQTVSGFVLHSALFAMVAFSVSIPSVAILTMATVYSVAFTIKFVAGNARKDLEAIGNAALVNSKLKFASKSE